MFCICMFLNWYVLISNSVNSISFYREPPFDSGELLRLLTLQTATAPRLTPAAVPIAPAAPPPHPLMVPPPVPGPLLLPPPPPAPHPPPQLPLRETPIPPAAPRPSVPAPPMLQPVPPQMPPSWPPAPVPPAAPRPPAVPSMLRWKERLLPRLRFEDFFNCSQLETASASAPKWLSQQKIQKQINGTWPDNYNMTITIAH